jgi:hypothetical protein
MEAPVSKLTDTTGCNCSKPKRHEGGNGERSHESELTLTDLTVTPQFASSDEDEVLPLMTRAIGVVVARGSDGDGTASAGVNGEHFVADVVRFSTADVSSVTASQLSSSLMTMTWLLLLRRLLQSSGTGSSTVKLRAALPTDDD